MLNLRRAGQATGRAFTESMRHPFKLEKDLSAFLQYQFKVHGCDGSAFVPVVAGGRVRSRIQLNRLPYSLSQNALAIHYTRNDDVLR